MLRIGKSMELEMPDSEDGLPVIPAMSASFVQLVLQRACDLGADRSEVLKDTLLNARMIGRPDAWVPNSCVYILADNAARVSGNPYLCYELSQEFDWLSGVPLPEDVSEHPSIGDLVICWLKHTNNMQRSTKFELSIRGETAVIAGHRLFPTRHPTGQADGWDMSAWAQLFREQLDRADISSNVSVLVSDPAAIPPELHDISSVKKGTMAKTEFRFPAEWLLSEANPIIYWKASQTPIGRPVPDIDTMFRMFNYSFLPSFPGFAKFVGYEPHTLQRRLSAMGTSFSYLVDGGRRYQAEQLLKHSDLKAETISEELGYTNPAAFSRAFKRWRGKSPSSWRATLHVEPPQEKC